MNVGVENFASTKYQVIYADPPWQYRDKASSGRRGVAYKYRTMSIEEIQSLPVYRIADDNCALFLWVTAPLMDVGIETLKRWGFAYKTVAFTWIKTTKRDKLHWGMGNWTRANPEYVLLGIRGRMKRVSAGVHSVVMAPIGRHSEKPAEVRERIVQLFGDVPRVELFARERVDGWEAIGDEIDGRDIRDVLGGRETEGWLHGQTIRHTNLPVASCNQAVAGEGRRR